MRKIAYKKEHCPMSEVVVETQPEPPFPVVAKPEVPKRSLLRVTMKDGRIFHF
jgi:hypothetical protein